MAAKTYCLGIIFSVFLALKQAEAVTCYRCVYMELEDPSVTPGPSTTPAGEDSGNAERLIAGGAVTYGNAECKEEGEEFRIDVATQDTCSADLELGPVAAYEPLKDIVKWSDILTVEGDVSAEGFKCQKSKFVMSSSENDLKLHVWYRGCAYEVKEGECTDAADLAEKDVFLNVYADVTGASKESVSFEGESCACAGDTCNSGMTVQFSHLLVALCSFVIYAVIRK